jgi:CubicO group peptidase (beta-lactamase class C family)
MTGRFSAAVLAVSIALSTGVGVAGQQSERVKQLSAAFPEIDRLFSEFATRGHVPGIAYGILIDGVLVHTGRAGVRELAGKTPVTDDTVFRIASMTKSFTALCILKLRDEGKLSLDDPAEKYVPELAALKYPTADSPKLTLRHLMSHATGFPEDTPGAISNSRSAKPSSRRCSRPVFPSRPHRAPTTSTRTTASPSSAASSRACRASRTRNT